MVAASRGLSSRLLQRAAEAERRAAIAEAKLLQIRLMCDEAIRNDEDVDPLTIRDILNGRS